MLRDILRSKGYPAVRKHVTTLMRKIGIDALYRKPNASAPHSGAPVYPDLLRNVTVDRPS